MRGLGPAAVLVLTSLGAYLWGRHRSLSDAGLWAATAATLEAIGLGALFFAANSALTLLTILGGRALTGTFVSVYEFDQIAIAAVSLLQGIVARWWCDRG